MDALAAELQQFQAETGYWCLAISDMTLISWWYTLRFIRDVSHGCVTAWNIQECMQTDATQSKWRKSKKCILDWFDELFNDLEGCVLIFESDQNHSNTLDFEGSFLVNWHWYSIRYLINISSWQEEHGHLEGKLRVKEAAAIGLRCASSFCAAWVKWSEGKAHGWIV